MIITVNITFTEIAIIIKGTRPSHSLTGFFKKSSPAFPRRASAFTFCQTIRPVNDLPRGLGRPRNPREEIA